MSVSYLGYSPGRAQSKSYWRAPGAASSFMRDPAKLATSIYIYIYMCICVYVCVYIYICTYIYIYIHIDSVFSSYFNAEMESRDISLRALSSFVGLLRFSGGATIRVVNMGILTITSPNIISTNPWMSKQHTLNFTSLAIYFLNKYIFSSESIVGKMIAKSLYESLMTEATIEEARAVKRT